MTLNWIQYFVYLDRLRSSGTVNMYGAVPYLAREFTISEKEAKYIWKKWYDTFTDEPAVLRASRITE
jgi:hypothetical protein